MAEVLLFCFPNEMVERGRYGVEEGRIRRLASGAVRIRGRGACRVTIYNSILLFYDMIKPSCLAKQAVRLRDLSLLVSSAVNLESSLSHFIRLADVVKWSSAAFVVFTSNNCMHAAHGVIKVDCRGRISSDVLNWLYLEPKLMSLSPGA